GLPDRTGRLRSRREGSCALLQGTAPIVHAATPERLSVPRSATPSWGLRAASYTSLGRSYHGPYSRRKGATGHREAYPGGSWDPAGLDRGPDPARGPRGDPVLPTGALPVSQRRARGQDQEDAGRSRLARDPG